MLKVLIVYARELFAGLKLAKNYPVILFFLQKDARTALLNSCSRSERKGIKIFDDDLMSKSVLSILRRTGSELKRRQ